MSNVARRPLRSLPAPAGRPSPPHLRSLRLRLADGAWTTLHVATHRRAARRPAPGRAAARRGRGALRRRRPEGFSAAAGQFDSDITGGRHPRAALALCGRRRLLAIAADGRGDDDAGLTLAELAEALAALGATQALNLDGGGSTSLVWGGRLRNRPREAYGTEIPGGRPVTTALVFTPR